jgi:hypothetical protein
VQLAFSKTFLVTRLGRIDLQQKRKI